ncbi:MAG: hypothetical protein GYB33_07955 [Gammaproteobacteria bacterium]|nr:hypothetical protein [Gammaproteobacteria bacterium]
MNSSFLLGAFVTGCSLIPGLASAHDPVFGVGPHVLYKHGYEVHLGAHLEKFDERRSETEFELKYGITGDWVAGIGTSYQQSSGHAGNDGGRGPSSLSTKYRFWRHDTFGTQESAAVFGKVIFDDGDNGHGAKPDGNDYLFGLAYGFEGRKWYRWASVRHRINAETTTGLERPNIWLVDLVGGIRFSPTEYHEPDWVWMLELNGELSERASQAVGSDIKRLGGNQWFLSPGLMWTLRNFAVKAGVQLPVIDDLSADQKADDYRALIDLELHF